MLPFEENSKHKETQQAADEFPLGPILKEKQKPNQPPQNLMEGREGAK